MELFTQSSENQPEIPQNRASGSEASPPNARQNAGSSTPRWEPLNSIDRRVVGVLIEKAKTTPDAYPLTLNVLCNGCNQKSNRSPLMQLEPEAVAESLDRLRKKGAVFITQGGGRVDKFRHNMYEWLGVSKKEIAVMAELLLRGAQSQGELRARAARMEPIAGLSELQPIVQALKQKRLIVSLTPEGRGHILTHNLYQPHEMEKLLEKCSHGVPSETLQKDKQDAAPVRPVLSPPGTPPAHGSTPSIVNERIDSLQRENEDLRNRVTDLNIQVAELTERMEQTERSLRELSDSLGGG